jgi:nucleoside-diphosphate-sugar epimerase
MRVVVIGGTGHIGTYLVPRLVEAGYEVVSVSRGERAPYQPHRAWTAVRQHVIDRTAEEANGSFGRTIALLHAHAVIDLTCYTLESAMHLVDALRGHVEHFLHCGTIWVHGPSVRVPTTEDEPRRPFGDYGCRKAAIEAWLLSQAQDGGFPATVLHPGHLVGPGWTPVNPAGHFTPQVFTNLAAGVEVALPNFGLETLHHVHADDVAQAFALAIARPRQAIGESFHVVSPAAWTLRGYAERMAAWFGREPRLEFLPWPEWRRGTSEREAAFTLDHLSHSPNCSIDKARRLLGYAPRYDSIEAVQESVRWLMEKGVVQATR